MAKTKQTTAKLDAELLRQARVVAAFRGVDLYDYLDSILRGRVVTDFNKIVKFPLDGKAEKGGAS